MPNRPTRIKETVESDVKTVKGVVITQLVIAIVIIGFVCVGGFFIYTYIMNMLSQFQGSFGDIPFPGN